MRGEGEGERRERTGKVMEREEGRNEGGKEGRCSWRGEGGRGREEGGREEGGKEGRCSWRGEGGRGREEGGREGRER